MLDASSARILHELDDQSLVLDVGGWAKPFPRADWVIDLFPHATRGLYEYDRATARERFDETTWVQRDICSRDPWPFADSQFDFAVCAQTLEDVRDPVWVSQELTRVARAGYVEVPSRLAEQSLGIDGERWAGWSHHRWLCDVSPGEIRFVHKPHFLHARPGLHFSSEFRRRLTVEQHSACLWWTDGFAASEQVFVDGDALDAYLSRIVEQHVPPVRARTGRLGRLRRG